MHSALVSQQFCVLLPAIGRFPKLALNMFYCEYSNHIKKRLKAILRDEYLTSAVRTKEGDKAGSNQPPARNPV